MINKLSVTRQLTQINQLGYSCAPKIIVNYIEPVNRPLIGDTSSAIPL